MAATTSSKSRGGARAGAGRPRAADADATILESALDLLEKHGYARLSIDAVAAAAGVAKTTIYRRWPSKPALIAAAAAPLYCQLMQPPDTGSLRGDLVHLVGVSRELMMGRPGRILHMLIRASAEHPELAEPLQAALYSRRQIYVQVLNRALARGELRPDIDQDLLTDLLLGPLWSRMLITQTPTPPELVPAVVDAVLDGVRRNRPDGN